MTRNGSSILKCSIDLETSVIPNLNIGASRLFIIQQTEANL